MDCFVRLTAVLRLPYQDTAVDLSQARFSIASTMRTKAASHARTAATDTIGVGTITAAAGRSRLFLCHLKREAGESIEG